MKIKQYNNAIDELKELGYLTEAGGNRYTFNEIAVISKGNNEKESVIPKSNNGLIPKGNNDVMPKKDNALLPKDIRNNTNTTIHNTIDNTEEKLLQPAAADNFSMSRSGKEERVAAAQVLTSKEALNKYGLSACTNRVAAGYSNCYWISGELVKLV